MKLIDVFSIHNTVIVFWFPIFCYKKLQYLFNGTLPLNAAQITWAICNAKFLFLSKLFRRNTDHDMIVYNKINSLLNI